MFRFVVGACAAMCCAVPVLAQTATFETNPQTFAGVAQSGMLVQQFPAAVTTPSMIAAIPHPSTADGSFLVYLKGSDVLMQRDGAPQQLISGDYAEPRLTFWQAYTLVTTGSSIDDAQGGLLAGPLPVETASVRPALDPGTGIVESLAGTGDTLAGVGGVLASNAAAPLAPVPEPGEWAMMAAGLSVVAYAARRRQRR